MFNTALKNNILTLEGKISILKEDKGDLENEIWELKSELSKLQRDKKSEEDELKHLTKMAKERNEIELEKHKMKVDSESQTKIHGIKQDYSTKLEERLHKEVEGIKDMYAQVLDRLPNINAALNVGASSEE